MARACVFDVNETLLDMRALDPLFERAFGDAAARTEWFGQLQQSWLVATVTGVYEEFGTIGGTALRMVAERRDMSLPGEEATNILGAIRELPPHPEVGEALARLREAGVRLATLTNSTQEVAEAQIENSGLGEHFEKVFSADAVKRLKPAPEPYRMAARSLGVEIGQIRLVAAHAWDVAGAMRVGCAAAFVARLGKVLDPLFEPPDVVGVDLREVAGRILEAENDRA
ncbi:MAG TPA: haloacid dehalogenase type II [Rubrobacteraceae bacterium]|nr:haloacid dehalogenase type II [Rubrobacteraceae bacterium]